MFRIDPGGSVSSPIMTGPQIRQLSTKLPLRLFSDGCERSGHGPVICAEELDYIRRRSSAAPVIAN